MSVLSVTSLRACGRCGCTKPLTPEFWHRDKRLKSGFGRTCKVCRRAKNRRWLAANKERRREYNRRWEEQNRERRAEMHRAWAQENADARREYMRKFAAENAESIAAYPSSQPEAKRRYAKRSRERHREEISERVAQDRRRNPDKYRRYYRSYVEKHGREQLNERARRYREYNKEALRAKWRVDAHRRRTVKNPDAGRHTYEEAWRMLEDQDHLCAYCESPLFGEFEIDHMIPVSRDGGNTWENIAIACMPCNRSKGRMTAEEFMEVRRGEERSR